MKTLGIELPVVPVKGQMILYKCAEDFLPAMVLAKGRYAIPRKDGHILVGSTLEYAGFDKTPSDEALASLQASAVTLMPRALPHAMQSTVSAAETWAICTGMPRYSASIMSRMA